MAEQTETPENAQEEVLTATPTPEPVETVQEQETENREVTLTVSESGLKIKSGRKELASSDHSTLDGALDQIIENLGFVRSSPWSKSGKVVKAYGIRKFQ